MSCPSTPHRQHALPNSSSPVHSLADPPRLSVLSGLPTAALHSHRGRTTPPRPPPISCRLPSPRPLRRLPASPTTATDRAGLQTAGSSSPHACFVPPPTLAPNQINPAEAPEPLLPLFRLTNVAGGSLADASARPSPSCTLTAALLSPSCHTPCKRRCIRRACAGPQERRAQDRMLLCKCCAGDCGRCCRISPLARRRQSWQGAARCRCQPAAAGSPRS